MRSAAIILPAIDSRRPQIFVGLWLLAMALGWGAGLSAAPQTATPSDPYDGTWAGESISIEISVGEEEYEFLIAFQGRQLEGSATGDERGLDGSFLSAGAEFPFQASVEGDRLRFETGGTVYELQRQARVRAPTNPLAAGAQPTNPLAAGGGAGAAASPPEESSGLRSFGEYRLQLPEGWQASVDASGSVAVTPPDTADGSETYAVTKLNGIADPASPEASAVLFQLLGQAALLAEMQPVETVEQSGRALAIHTFTLPQAQSRLSGYMRPSNGVVVAVIASGNAGKLAARETELRQLAASIEYGGAAAANPSSGGPDPEQAAAQGPRPAGAVRTDPNAPPFQAGQVSDGQPQSQQWIAHLSGKLLTKMESYSSGAAGGYSSKDRMLLYPNGRFEYAGSSLVSVTVPGATGNSGGADSASGWWRVLTVNGMSYLGFVIDGQNQEIYSQLNMQGQQTFLDGERVYVTVPQ